MPPIMKKPGAYARRRLFVLLGLFCLPGLASAQTYVGNLNGTSTNSTFEVGSINNMPTQGWTNFSGLGRQWTNGGGNGAVIGQTDFGNYAVQYGTGATLASNSLYTLSFVVGFVSAGTTGTATYGVTFGGSTDAGSTITGLSANTGLLSAVIDRTSGGAIQSTLGASSANSQAVTITFLTGAVSANPLYVRWAQTNTTGTSAGQDFFGFDNVTLSVAAVPEPATYAAIFGAGALGFVAWRRRRSA